MSPPTSPLGGAVVGIGMGVGLSFAEQKELLAMQIQLQNFGTESAIEKERHVLS